MRYSCWKCRVIELGVEAHRSRGELPHRAGSSEIAAVDRPALRSGQPTPVLSRIGSDCPTIKLSSLAIGVKTGYTLVHISQIRARRVIFTGL
jgi:hypothetical protein